MKSQITFSSDGRSIIKRCLTQEECSREISVYQLNLSYTPELIKIIDERTIEISHVNADSFSTLPEIDFRIPGKMLATLHNATLREGLVLCHIDTNPRNYLIEKETGRYFFIDFAESRYSYPEHDLINFLLFWAAILEPERFISAMKEFLAGYDAKTLQSNDKIRQFKIWFTEFDDRRRKYCKNPCIVPEYQDKNRAVMMKDFLTRCNHKI